MKIQLMADEGCGLALLSPHAAAVVGFGNPRQKHELGLGVWVRYIDLAASGDVQGVGQQGNIDGVPSNQFLGFGREGLGFVFVLGGLSLGQERTDLGQHSIG